MGIPSSRFGELRLPDQPGNTAGCPRPCLLGAGEPRLPARSSGMCCTLPVSTSTKIFKQGNQSYRKNAGATFIMPETPSPGAGGCSALPGTVSIRCCASTCFDNLVPGFVGLTWSLAPVGLTWSLAPVGQTQNLKDSSCHLLFQENRASCDNVRDKNKLFPGDLFGVLGSAALVGRCWLLLARLPGGLCSVPVPGSVSVAAARYMHSTSSRNTLSLPRVVEGS